MLKAWSGEPEAAIERATRAMRLSPHDTQVFVMQFAIGLAHFFAKRYAEALSWAEKAIRERPDHIPAASLVAASSALVGDHANVEIAMARLFQLVPDLRVSNLNDVLPIRRSDHFDRWAEAMRKSRAAGMNGWKAVVRIGAPPRGASASGGQTGITAGDQQRQCHKPLLCLEGRSIEDEWPSRSIERELPQWLSSSR